MNIQTTHVGSLPRPVEMITKQLKNEIISADDLRRYVDGIVKKQLELGISYVNNGEIPRTSYVNSTMGRISGFGETCLAPLPMDMEEVPEYSRRFSGRNGLITLNPKAPIKLPACSSELEYTGEASLRQELIMLADIFNIHTSSASETESGVFFTAPSPGTVALFLGNNYYPDYRTYVEKLGDILKTEYEIINEYGVFLQIDCPDIAMGRHTAFKHLSELQFLEIVDMNIGILNKALINIESDKCRTHICWGNYPGTHHRDIELGRIFRAITKLKPRYISLESSNHRHSHEWEVFREIPFPEEKVLLPGVIDTTSNIVEHPNLVRDRLLNFSNILGPERIIASTDCGFASTASATSVAAEAVWLKLKALVKGAELASRAI